MCIVKEGPVELMHTSITSHTDNYTYTVINSNHHDVHSILSCREVGNSAAGSGVGPRVLISRELPGAAGGFWAAL